MNAVKVEPAVIEAAIKEYTAIRDELMADYDEGIALTQITSPGLDRPSQVYTNAAKSAGALHQSANLKLREALDARIALLEATLKQFHETDHSKAADFNSKD